MPPDCDISERETDVHNLTVSPTSDGGESRLKLVAFTFMPAILFDQQSPSFLLKPSLILSQHAPSTSSSASSSFDHKPKSLMLFLGHDHPPHRHITIPTNTIYHSQLIYGFIQTQHQLLISFSIFKLYITHPSRNGSLCPL